MNSLMNYGSDGENSNNSDDIKEAIAASKSSVTIRRASDAIYDPVPMDMSEESNNNNSSDDSDSEKSPIRLHPPGSHQTDSIKHSSSHSDQRRIDKEDCSSISHHDRKHSEKSDDNKKDKYDRNSKHNSDKKNDDKKRDHRDSKDSKRHRDDDRRSRDEEKRSRDDEKKSRDNDKRKEKLIKEDKNNDRNERDHRDDRRDRDKKDDKDRRRDRDKGREKEREKERHRERSRDKSKDRNRDKSKDRNCDKNRDRSRDRDRDRDRRYLKDEKSRDRYRSERRSKDKERIRSRSRSRDQGSHRFSYRDERNKSKLAQLEKLGIEIKADSESQSTQEPNYYNPLATATQGKYAEQIQKRKLLWANKKVDDTKSSTTAATNNTWVGTTFTHDQDGKVTAKFKRLMGIKEDVPIATTGAKPDILKKQEEMFNNMEQQYEVARATTHTQRGVGLGYATGGFSFPR